MPERLTPERLAEIRERHPVGCGGCMGECTDELLAHIDAQQAQVERLEVALQLRADLLRDLRRVEYGVARPASMPDMSGRDTWTLIVSATFRSLDDAETAQQNVPALRDREAVIVQRLAPGEWERAREGSTP